jgi:CSLREA domain-containing protein
MRHPLIAILLLLIVLLTYRVSTNPDPVVAAPLAEIVVNSTNDVFADDGTCSLREAISAANNDQPSGSLPGECAAGSGADTITLPAGAYTFTLNGVEDANLSGDLDISGDLTIEGADRNTTIINAAHLDRVVEVISGTVLIQDVTITGGHAPNGDSGTAGEDGGGVFNSGNLQFIRAIIQDNEAGSGGTNRKGGDGGGIYSTGQLSLIQSRIANNRAGDGNAEGAGGNGGGLRTSAQTTLIYSELSNNFAGNGGDGLRCGNGGAGGGIYSSASATFQISTVSGNRAGAACGGSGNGSNGGGIFHEGGTLIIVNGTVADNHVPDFGRGGGIAGNGTLGNTILANNTSGDEPNDCEGTLAAPEGYVLLESEFGCSLIGDSKGVIIGKDPVIGDLADNGGFSYTHALLGGSPALDNGNCLFNTFDQRGLPRPVDLPGYPNAVFGCDLGAYEAQTEPPVATATPTATAEVTVTPTATPDPTASATATATTTLPTTHTPTVTPSATGTPGEDNLYLPLTMRTK